MIRKKVVAIVPAREKSTRLKNKNMKKFNGQPLIQWTIESALKSKFINKIIVTSDSDRILKFCSNFKSIIVSKRPKKLATKNSKIKDVVLYEIKNNELKNYDYFVLLQPTSPLRTLKTIDESIKLCIKKKANTCVSFYKIKKKFLNLFSLNEKNKIKFTKKINNLKFNYFIPSGDIYIAKIKSFIKLKTFITKNTLPYFITNPYSDIDELSEFKQAEKIQE